MDARRARSVIWRTAAGVDILAVVVVLVAGVVVALDVNYANTRYIGT